MMKFILSTTVALALFGHSYASAQTEAEADNPAPVSDVEMVDAMAKDDMVEVATDVVETAVEEVTDATAEAVEAEVVEAAVDDVTDATVEGIDADADAEVMDTGADAEVVEADADVAEEMPTPEAASDVAPEEAADVVSEEATVVPAPEPREEYLPGYDFSEALISHVLTDQASIYLDQFIEALENGEDRRSTLLMQKLDVLRLTHAGYAAVDLTDSDNAAAALRDLQAHWQSLEAASQAIDEGTIEGIVGRTMLSLTDYLDDDFMPRLETLRAADDLAASDVSPNGLYLNFLGLQSMMDFEASAEYSTVRLFDSLPNADDIEDKIAASRQKLEPMRRLAVDVRKGLLTDEKQATYKDQLSALADEIKAFSAFLRSSVTEQ
ncbi:hypothetical protein N9L14_02530 [Alphaproteobacteria bacterium]|nr:hypothetical protein [Alphaproteobacteria bacterium]